MFQNRHKAVFINRKTYTFVDQNQERWQARESLNIAESLTI
jgi:hypothetical protein